MLEEADHCESGSIPAGSFCIATQKIPCVYYIYQHLQLKKKLNI